MKYKPLVIGDLVARIPIIQGGMGVGISLSGLAGAVAAEGGIGIISTAQIGFRESDFELKPIEANLRSIKEEIKTARDIAKGGIIGVNIMVATKQYEEYVKAAVKAGVDLIISGAGLPTNLPEYVENTKTKIAPIVSSLKAASVLLKLWDRHYKKVPDLLVIEGPKAGGHLGFSKDQLENLNDEDFDKVILDIKDLVNKYEEKYNRPIPVVAAGGVYNKSDMEHFMRLGIDGVQIGSRFVTTYECDAEEAYKMAYINCKKEDIKIVNSPVGMPGRAIINPFMVAAESEKQKISKCYQCIKNCNPKTIPYCITDALIHSAKGETDQGLLFCGANAYKAEKLESVKDVIEEFCGI